MTPTCLVLDPELLRATATQAVGTLKVLANEDRLLLLCGRWHKLQRQALCQRWAWLFQIMRRSALRHMTPGLLSLDDNDALALDAASRAAPECLPLKDFDLRFLPINQCRLGAGWRRI